MEFRKPQKKKKKVFPNCTLYVAYLKKEKEDPKFAKQA